MKRTIGYLMILIMVFSFVIINFYDKVDASTGCTYIAGSSGGGSCSSNAVCPLGTACITSTNSVSGTISCSCLPPPTCRDGKREGIEICDGEIDCPSPSKCINCTFCRKPNTIRPPG